MSDLNQETQPQGPRIMDFQRLSMWTATPGVENKRARLGFGMLDINPRISIFTNNPEDTINKGIITSPMNPETFLAFLNRLDTICKGPAGEKEKIECFQGFKDRVKVSDLVFGKDDEGYVWLSIVAPNRPNIKFTFEMSDWHTLTHSNGAKFTAVECSVLEAQAKIQLLRSVYGNYFAKILETPRPDYAGMRKNQTQKKGGDFQKKPAAATEVSFEDIDF